MSQVLGDIAVLKSHFAGKRLFGILQIARDGKDAGAEKWRQIETVGWFYDRYRYVFQVAPHFSKGIGVDGQPLDRPAAIDLQAEPVIAFKVGRHQNSPQVSPAEREGLEDPELMVGPDHFAIDGHLPARVDEMDRHGDAFHAAHCDNVLAVAAAG